MKSSSDFQCYSLFAAENKRTVASLKIVPLIIDIMKSNYTTKAVISSALVCLSRCVDDCGMHEAHLFFLLLMNLFKVANLHSYVIKLIQPKKFTVMLYKCIYKKDKSLKF